MRIERRPSLRPRTSGVLLLQAMGLGGTPRSWVQRRAAWAIALLGGTLISPGVLKLVRGGWGEVGFEPSAGLLRRPRS
jgi:hypothetical protein